MRIMIYSKDLHEAFVGNISIDIPPDVASKIVMSEYLEEQDIKKIIPYIDSRYDFDADFVKYRYKLTNKPE